MDQWQYKLEWITVAKHEELLALNNLGKQGWEAVQVLEKRQSNVGDMEKEQIERLYLFKRKLTVEK